MPIIAGRASAAYGAGFAAITTSYLGPFGAYDSLASATVGATAVPSITFAGIPTGYKHLQIRVINKDSQASGSHSSRMQFNGDTGSNYTYHALVGDGSSATGGALTSQTNLFPGYVMGTTGTNVFAVSLKYSDLFLGVPINL